MFLSRLIGSGRHGAHIFTPKKQRKDHGRTGQKINKMT